MAKSGLLLVALAALAAPSFALSSVSGPPVMPRLALRGLRGGCGAETFPEMSARIKAFLARPEPVVDEAAARVQFKGGDTTDRPVVPEDEDPERLYSTVWKRSDMFKNASPDEQQTMIDLRVCRAAEALGMRSLPPPRDVRSKWEKFRNSLGIVGHDPYRPKMRTYPGKELVQNVFVMVKGVASFVIISAVAHFGYELKYGPRRSTPPPVRTTTGKPYEGGREYQ